MKRDGYEADKNDIIVDFKGIKLNLTSNWDGMMVLNGVSMVKVYFIGC
jgi:hypothetical protein